METAEQLKWTIILAPWVLILVFLFVMYILPAVTKWADDKFGADKGIGEVIMMIIGIAAIWFFS